MQRRRTSTLYHKVFDRPVDDAVLVVERTVGERREALFACA